MTGFGDRLRMAREARNLSRPALTKIMDCGASTIWRWEKGEREPDIATLGKLAEVLNTTTSYLVGDRDGKWKVSNELSGGDIISVPIFHRSYSSYRGMGFPDGDKIYSESEEFLNMPGSFVGTISGESFKRPFMINAEGDSMIHAGIMDGAQLLINPAEPIFDGDSVLLEYGDQKDISVKRVYRLSESVIEIRSASADGWKRIFNKEEQDHGLFRIIGKVMWYGNTPKRG